MKNFLILFLCVGALSCSPSKTVFDYDKGVDFSEFKSYKFTEDDLEETVGFFNRERILTSLENELSAKGLTKSEEPDLFVNAHIKSEQKIEVDAASQVGYGSLGWQTANSASYMKYDEYTVGTLFITMADYKTEIIIWQGAGTREIDEDATGEKRKKNITEIIQQIMVNYPPGE
jgi:hypothetical protein